MWNELMSSLLLMLSFPATITLVAIVSFLFFSVSALEKDEIEDFEIANLPAALADDWKGEILDNPSIKASGEYIQCYCPANGQLLDRIRPASKHKVDVAIARSLVAQKQWQRTTFKERRRVLRSLMRYIVSHQDIIARAACMDSGKTMVDAALGEILVTVEKINWLLKNGERVLQPERRRSVPLLMMYKRAEVRYEPLGVVAACVSWNYPFHNILGPIVSSIFAGNGIIVKGSENTAWSSLYYISIVQKALEACGHDPSLVLGINCWPDVANHLTSHPDIAHITFIGSREVGKAVARSASASLPALCIELGGKDAAIILDDVKNVDRLSSILLRGVFQNAGQNCIGIERVVALPNTYRKLVDILESRIDAIRLGSIMEDASVDVGAMISAAGFDRLERLIDDAVQQGAKLLVGGRRFIHPKYPKGHYFSPTMLMDVTVDMEIAKEELFGPIFLLMKAQDVAEAIWIANSTDYALGGSVHGVNKMDIDQVIAGMKCGMIAVNDFAVFYTAQLPFGGVGGSGYGRFMGAEGLRSVCNVKSVCVDRFPMISTSIPSILDYPIADTKKAWEFCAGLVEFSVGITLTAKASGLWKLISNSRKETR